MAQDTQSERQTRYEKYAEQTGPSPGEMQAAWDRYKRYQRPYGGAKSGPDKGRIIHNGEVHHIK